MHILIAPCRLTIVPAKLGPREPKLHIFDNLFFNQFSLFFSFFLFFSMQKLKSQMAVPECGHFPASRWQSYSAHGEKHELHLAWKMVGWHCQLVVFVGRERILVTGRQTCCLSNLACLGSLSGPDRGSSEEDSQHNLGLVSSPSHS